MSIQTMPAEPDLPVEQPRLDAASHAPDAYRAMIALDRAVGLDPALRDLVSLRASIRNGCAYCIDMHTLDARARGETEQRLYAVAAWHEAPSCSCTATRRRPTCGAG